MQKATQMASIQRIKSHTTGRTSYRVQVRGAQHHWQSPTFTNRTDAEQWAYLTEMAVGRERDACRTPAHQIFFREVAERYKAVVLSDFNASAQQNRGAHIDWWVRRFGKLPLSEVTKERIAKARDALPMEGKVRNLGPGRIRSYSSRHTRSPATVNRYLYSLSHLFTVVVKDWDLLDHNPVRAVQKELEPRRRVRFLSDEERRRLLSECRKSRWSSLHCLVLLAMSTGARRGELINLKWSDISLHSAPPEIYLHETKNGDSRFVPLFGQSLGILRRLKRQNRAGCRYAFPAPHDSRQPYYFFDAHWYRALQAAGIEDFRFHDLRHTCASYLARQGTSLLEIADVLGHRSLRMTLRYAHLADSHKRICLEKMVQAQKL
jgi:integrase